MTQCFHLYSKIIMGIYVGKYDQIYSDHNINFRQHYIKKSVAKKNYPFSNVICSHDYK